MLGPVLNLVNGPIVGEAIKDPGNRINKLATEIKDDRKLIEEIYLSVLNRLPNAKEKAEGIAALRAAGEDHAKMMAEYNAKVAAFKEYGKGVPEKQKAWEAGLKNQKPTAWTTLDVYKAESKHGPPASAKPGATLASYTKVMLAPVSVSFHKDWAKTVKVGTNRQISPSDQLQEVEAAVVKAMQQMQGA